MASLDGLTAFLNRGGGSRPKAVGGRRVRLDVLSIAHDLVAAWDAAAVLFAGYCCAALYNAAGPTTPMSLALQSDPIRIVLVGALLAPFTLASRELFSFERLRATASIGGSSARRVFLLFAVILIFGFLTRSLDSVPRTWLIAWSAAILVLTLGARLALGRFLGKLERRGLLRENVAIVGNMAAADGLLAHLHRTKPPGMDVIGLFETSPGHLDLLVNIGQTGILDTIVVALPEQDVAEILRVTDEIKALDVKIVLCPYQGDLPLPLPRDRDLAGAPTWLLASRPIRRWGVVLKTVEDKLIGFLLLLLVLPLVLLAALAIRLESPGPILFRQKRHGWNNTEFDVLKFRTMWSSAAPQGGDGGRQTQGRNDARITRVGRVLRRTSIDELPQLINVLRGDMSLVGPRPHPVVMRTGDRLGREIVAEYAHRHRVKPGITGWAQVNGLRGATRSEDQVRKRVAHDIEYIENWSILFDLKILVLTPLKLLLDTDNAF
jgi:Undecaprenyl-phosphate glucose phosphotransferase